MKDQIENMSYSMDEMTRQLARATSDDPKTQQKVLGVVSEFHFSKRKVYLRLYEDAFHRLQRLEYLCERARKADEYGLLQVMDALGERLNKLTADKMEAARPHSSILLCFSNKFCETVCR